MSSESSYVPLPESAPRRRWLAVACASAGAVAVVALARPGALVASSASLAREDSDWTPTPRLELTRKLSDHGREMLREALGYRPRADFVLFLYQMALQVLKDTYIAEFEIVKEYAEGFDLHPPARVDVMVGLGLVRERRPMLGCGVGAWRRGTVVGYNKENYKVQWDGDGTVQTGCFALITPARGYRVRVIGDARR